MHKVSRLGSQQTRALGQRSEVRCMSVAEGSARGGGVVWCGSLKGQRTLRSCTRVTSAATPRALVPVSTGEVGGVVPPPRVCCVFIVTRGSLYCTCAQVAR